MKMDNRGFSNTPEIRRTGTVEARKKSLGLIFGSVKMTPLV
jgi:hypothetical protein